MSIIIENKTTIKFKQHVNENQIKEFENKLIKTDTNNTKTLNLDTFVKSNNENKFDDHGTTFDPDVFSVVYDNKNKELVIEYLSSSEGVFKSFEKIFEQNKEVIESIKTNWYSDHERIKGNFYLDENSYNQYQSSYETIDLKIDQNQLKQLFNKRKELLNLHKNNKDYLLNELLKDMNNFNTFNRFENDFINSVIDNIKTHNPTNQSYVLDLGEAIKRFINYHSNHFDMFDTTLNQLGFKSLNDFVKKELDSLNQTKSR